MNPEAIRRLYDYHFAANHTLWERCIVGLTPEEFRRKLPYSLGSVRNQIVHLMNIEDRWFSALRGVAVPGILNPVYFGTQAAVRARWDTIEANTRDYLSRLTATELERPYDEHAAVWQVLFHVLNHGTDHRAQTLSMLAQLGAKSFAQDYYLHLMGKF
ncbi:DinB family protein [Candidatus Promineifilum breve]|uniref:DinB family protein n=1 Tax=Candidatus Promineifilum breve TaxID=1806508 RepID=A0A160T8Z1_9CHLR|nr:DinB family protein [Candidatus Promineifilum breve]CUS05460.2 DinB family protein [Candidatus Promineifilum breve]